MTYETVATLEIAGDEVDVPVRANVLVEPGAGVGGSWGAVIDGGLEAQWGGRWVDFDELEIDAGTRERVEESFAEIAFGDDSSIGPEDYDDE